MIKLPEQQTAAQIQAEIPKIIAALCETQFRLRRLQCIPQDDQGYQDENTALEAHIAYLKALGRESLFWLMIRLSHRRYMKYLKHFQISA